MICFTQFSKSKVGSIIANPTKKTILISDVIFLVVVVAIVVNFGRRRLVGERVKRQAIVISRNSSNVAAVLGLGCSP